MPKRAHNASFKAKVTMEVIEIQGRDRAFMRVLLVPEKQDQSIYYGL